MEKSVFQSGKNYTIRGIILLREEVDVIGQK